MAWKGDYHLNYNYQAPFYGLVSSNHVELMDCYDAPLEDYMLYAICNARSYLGCRGVYFPVGIGPLGLNTSCLPCYKEHGELFLGQKSNATYCAVIMAMRWYGTRNLEYARNHAYPFIKQVADFWEDYLVYENGRYFILNDAIHEVEFYENENFIPKRHDEINPIISVGLIKMTLRCLLDMREALGADAEKASKWRDMLEKIGPIIIFEKDGKMFLRATERGTEFTGLVLQYLYPAGEIGSISDKRFWDAARNSFDTMNAWINDNLFCSYFPAAARLGVEPTLILSRLKDCIAKKSLPNTLFRFNGGGMENCSTIPSTVNEMLLQSYKSVIRLFPTWNFYQNASYHNLRAYGAFLVIAEIKNGVVSAEIVSEKGMPLSVCEPKGGGYVLIKKGTALSFNAGILTVLTEPEEHVEIKKTF